MGRPSKYNLKYADVVKLLCEDKLSIPLAADKLKCSSDAIRYFVARHDIQLPITSDRVNASTPSIKFADPAYVQDMLNNNCTFSQIASKYDCKCSAVADFVKKHNLDTFRHNSDPSLDELLDMYCEKLMTIDSIAKHFSISADRVRRCLQQYGIQRSSVQKQLACNNTAQLISKSALSRIGSMLPSAEIVYNEIQDSSVSKVAKKYSVSESSIRAYLRRNGLKIPTHLIPVDKNKLKAALDSGKTIKEIAEEFNRSDATISSWVRKYKLQRSDEGLRRYAQARSEKARVRTLELNSSNLPTPSQLQDYVNSYKNYHEIAQMFGCSASTIGNCVERYGTVLPADYKDVVVAKYVSKGRSTVIERYGVFPYALCKYSETAQKTLLDKDLLHSFIESIPIKERSWPRVASDLGVSVQLVKSYYCKYDLHCEFSDQLGSSLEEQLRRYLDKLNISYDRNVRSIIAPQELDFYFQSKHVAIEVNGNWSHSVSSVGKYSPLDRNYHLTKTQRCTELGIRLIHLFEYEMSNTAQWHKVKLFLEDVISDSYKIVHARKCVVKNVSKSEEQAFLSEYHLQGYVSSSVCLGLYYENSLVSIMSFGKPRFSSKHQWELLRLCTVYGVRVCGGAAKLFAHFIREFSPQSVISYCDLSKFTGNVYSQIGMTHLRNSPPNYRWVRYGESYSRYQTQKHKLQNLLGDNYDSKLSEADNMSKVGFVKIYDSGNAVFEWRKST